MKARRFKTLMVLTALVAGLIGWVPAEAGHDEDDHSDNVKMLTRQPIKIEKDLFAQGSDLAFNGRRVYAGSYQGTALYKIVGRRAGYLKQIGFHQCPGSQGDVSVVGTYVFVSIDAPASNNVENSVCNNTKSTGFVEAEKSTGREGIRVVDYSDPKQPKQVAFIATKCGSHTHTLVPDGDTTYMYIESYPISQVADCNAAAGHGAVSILKFPTNDPSKITFDKFFDVTQTPLPNDTPIGCHDLQAWPEKDIVIAACITEAQVWDIKDPSNPVILSRITNPDVQIWHSAAFTWDGKYAIISDEYGGAAGGGGCTGDKDSTVGAMWFYDVTDPKNPELAGHYSLPRVPPADSADEANRFRCTTHIYTILPMKDPSKYIAVSSFYSGGISVVDFSDPADPQEIGHYLMTPGGVNPDTWSAYWYNGRVYTNDHASNLGVAVFKVQGTGATQVKYYDGLLNPQTQVSNFR
ncbi:MAG: LVIVD repeat-containing protein [Actinomycetota bacterium]